jgi:conserved oligomeric Golgi complex subunit 3
LIEIHATILDERSQSDQVAFFLTSSHPLPPFIFQAAILEQKAPLTDAQQQAIDTLSAICTRHPLPRKLRGATDPTSVIATPPTNPGSSDDTSTHTVTTTTATTTTTTTATPSSTTTDAPPLLNNTTSFMKWFSELEAARASEAEGKFIAHNAALESHLTSIDSLIQQTDDITAAFESLSQAHLHVSSRTAALQDTCESLVGEREKLMVVADLITSKLAYFNELEKTTAAFQQSNSNNNISSTVDYLSLLRKLDDSLQYISSHPHYLDAPAYSTKLRQLQSRTLSGIRSKVAASLRAASQQAQRQGEEEEREQQGNKEHSTSSSTSETASATTSAAALQSLLHVRFRAAAEPQLKDLLRGLEQKAKGGSRPEYTRLLRDCEVLFCEARLALLQPPTAARFQDAQKKTAATNIITNKTSNMSLVDFLRDGCAYLIQLAQVEYQLFSNFFPDRAASVGPAVISPLMDPLCTLLYDAMRPATVSLKNIDALCDLINVLQTEIVDNNTGNSGASSSTANATVKLTLEPALRRTLADLQERLTWRAQAVVREEILAFTPTSQDLDYPAVLGGEIKGEEEIREEARDEASPSSLLWYPPVRKALFLLSKIYRAVPSQTFNGLAQEAIAAAMSQVLKGGRIISSVAAAAAASRNDNSSSSSSSSAAADGHLFTIKQLLILREQIAMYQPDFAAVTERDLDFTHTREAIRRMMTGQLSFLSLSSDNAVLQLVSKGAPRLLESQLDAKKELERQLKAACENFIMFATKLAVEPLLTFITKVTAVRVGTSSSSSNSDQKPLKEHAFASPERLSEVAAAVNAALTASVPNVISKIRLYITNPTTQSILVKPIVSNIGEAHGQIASLLSGEYTEEEAGKIGFMDADKLKGTLNTM